MATLASFDSMLNEYLTYDLMREEMFSRMYLLDKVEKDENWHGGNLVVPFEGAKGTSIKYGGLTAENDIHEYDYVRGNVGSYKEVWGTLRFNAKDLHQHVPEGAKKKGLVNKQSFLRILPDQIENFLVTMKETVSVNLMNGQHFAKLTADATSNDGNMTVDRVERFVLGQKVTVEDDDATPLTGYVKSININTKVVNLVTTRGGSTVVDFSANQMTVAAHAKCYVEGADTATNVFTSLRDQLLSAANGGSANLFGKSKLAYPYLQAINISGAAWSAANVLESIFDAWTTICILGKGHATHVLMSFKHLGSALKHLEAGAGAYRHIETQATPFKYTEVVVGGVKGQLTLVGIHEMDDDVVMYMDWSALKLHSNQFFERHIDPNGNAYYTVRSSTGYYYVVDIRFYGELVLHAPCRCGIVYGISY